MIDVSVIIPSFNSESYIRQCIDSALKQTRVACEIICVDDGSTDQTCEILSEYGDSIRSLSQAHGGAYRARNRAAGEARGRWLAFLDADDEWLPQKLEKQLSLATDNVGLVYSDCLNTGMAERVAQRLSDRCSLLEGNIFDDLLVRNFITTSSVVIRRDSFERLGGFYEGLVGCADWDMWLRFSAEGGQIRACKEALTVRRWHEAQMSKNFRARQDDRLIVLRRTFSHAKRLGIDVDTADTCRAYASVWKSGGWYAAPADRWQAVRWFLRALTFGPFDGHVYKLIVKALIGRV